MEELVAAAKECAVQLTNTSEGSPLVPVELMSAVKASEGSLMVPVEEKRADQLVLEAGSKRHELFNSDSERARCARSRLSEEELASVGVNNKWVVANIVDHVIVGLNSSSTVLVTNILLERDLFPCSAWAVNVKKFRQDHDPTSMGTMWRERWTEALEHLLMPVNIKNKHWCLLVIGLRSGSVELWDSLKGPGSRLYSQIDKKRLQAFMTAFSPLTPELRFAVAQVPQQTGCNCGIFMLEFIRAFIGGQRDGSQVDVTEDRMPEFRARIMEELQKAGAGRMWPKKVRVVPCVKQPNAGEGKRDRMDEAPEVTAGGGKKVKVGNDEAEMLESSSSFGVEDEEVPSSAFAFEGSKTTAAQRPWTLLESPNGVLSNGGHTFAKQSEEEWTCTTRGDVGWSSGVHQWDVRLDRLAKGIVVGIAKEDLRFGLLCKNGHVIDGDNRDHPYLGAAVPTCATVSVCLDLDRKTLTFGSNGIISPIAAAFSNLEGVWYPYFALRFKNCTFTVTPK